METLTSADPGIDLGRLKADLLQLASIGADDEGGQHRLAFTDADMDGRRWLLRKIEENGGEGRLDSVANVIGRWFDDIDAPALVVGSHIDTVRDGGIFDGNLGVLAGLECVRVIREHNLRVERPIEVVAFSDEEGRFGGMLGAQAYCGKTTVDWVNQAVSVNGVRLADAMTAQGFLPEEVGLAARDPRSLHAFLELHIEQGPVLETKRRSVGVVTGISGVFKWIVHLIGKANHAGTAPMDMRSDAFMGLADFAHEIERIIDEDGSDASRITVGMVNLKPGYPHTVPGEVEFSIVGRDPESEIMHALAARCERVLGTIARRHRLKFEYDQLSWLDPQPCDDDVIATFERQARKLGHDPLIMPSGAGHDTQFMATVCPAGMIFVPSTDGISHAPDEHTEWSDVEIGANVLLHTMLEYAGAR